MVSSLRSFQVGPRPSKSDSPSWLCSSEMSSRMRSSPGPSPGRAGATCGVIFSVSATFSRSIDGPVEAIVEGEAAASFDHSLAHYLELAKGRYAGTQSRKEGIVVRPLSTLHSELLRGRLSFKTISNEFLLKEED